MQLKKEIYSLEKQVKEVGEKNEIELRQAIGEEK